MTRREQRIKKIRRRIEDLERQIIAAERKLDRLLDRRDKWEERLVLAELG